MSQSKYRAVKTVVDGITFASKKEATRYRELKLLERAKAISSLELQRVFELKVGENPEEPDEGEVIGKYIADFSYYDVGTNDWIVEDVKGFRTPLYRWKKKHVEAQYGITIREV